LQLFAGLEPNGFARGDCDFSARARVASNAGLARPHIEDSETPQFDALALCECPLHTLKHGLHGHLGLGFGDTRAIDYFVNDIELDQNHPPSGAFRPRLPLHPKPNDKIGFKALSRTPISRETFRRACSRFATGVAVATVLDPFGQPHGLTVNSFTSVSADPPLVLVCIDLGCSVLPSFQSSQFYGLSFLSEDQQALSNRFAVLPEGRFQGVEWTPAVNSGVPILEGVVGWMECRTLKQIEAGDHILFLGEVEAASTTDTGRPLLYFASGYRRIE
jgi:flavin reductase (DIM6/NTAB) family NADH-FMN oxidoreductase RutF